MNLESNKHQFEIEGDNSIRPKVYEFGPFRIDSENRMLYRDGEEVSLTPKQVETLMALIDGDGAILSKETLMDRLWGDSFVEESNLVQNIYVLRKTLGKGSSGRPMIETLRRRGYRFTEPVTPRNAAEPSGEIRQAFASRPNRKKRVAVYVLLAVLPLTFGAYLIGTGTSLPGLSKSTAPTVNGERSAVQELTTKNTDAIAVFNQGRNLLRQRLDPVKAAEYLSQALVHDPDFAEAHAWLAAAKVASGLIGTGRPADMFKEASAHLERAFKIQPNSSEALAIRGSLSLHADWDLPKAESDLLRSIEIDPNDGHAHGDLGLLYAYRGDLDRAKREIQTAINLNPSDLGYQRDLGRVYYFGRQYDLAIAHLTRIVEVNDQFSSAFIWLRLANEMQGNEEGAFKWFIRDQEKLNPERVDLFTSLYRSGGWPAVQKRHYEFLKQDQHRPNRQWVAARMAAQVGETDAAFKYIDAAIDNQQWQLITLNVDPAFDPIRADPRYAKVLARVRLY